MVVRQAEFILACKGEKGVIGGCCCYDPHTYFSFWVNETCFRTLKKYSSKDDF